MKGQINGTESSQETESRIRDGYLSLGLPQNPSKTNACVQTTYYIQSQSVISRDKNWELGRLEQRKRQSQCRDTLFG